MDRIRSVPMGPSIGNLRAHRQPCCRYWCMPDAVNASEPPGVVLRLVARGRDDV